MRARKPWRFLRFRVFGWNVRFTHGLLAKNARGPEVGGRNCRAKHKCTAARETVATRVRAASRPTAAPLLLPKRGATFGPLADAAASEANFPGL
jgi:hypothetical protein